MGRRNKRFVWISVILELSLLMGMGIYFLAHRNIQASEVDETQPVVQNINDESFVTMQKEADIKGVNAVVNKPSVKAVVSESSVNAMVNKPAKTIVSKPSLKTVANKPLAKAVVSKSSVKIADSKTEENDKPKCTSPTNIGGPYTVCPPFHMSFYHARKGDNLASIAKKNDLDFFTILSVNGLKTSNDIKIGQKLKIPNQRGIIHNVKRGQSLEDISLLYNVNIRKIIRVNQVLDPGEIKSGTELFIPDARTTVAFQKELLEKSGVYTDKGEVRSGSRSKRFGSLFAMLCKQNSKNDINSAFGYRRDPFNGGREFHAGVDIGQKYGTEVKAAMDGVVTYAGWMGGYGKLVVITGKNGYSTRYGHLSRITVRNGQCVDQGQRIGAVGSTGRSTGPHLHFEIRKGDKPLNPGKYVGSSQITIEPDEIDGDNGDDDEKPVAKASKSKTSKKTTKVAKSKKSSSKKH